MTATIEFNIFEDFHRKNDQLSPDAALTRYCLNTHDLLLEMKCEFLASQPVCLLKLPLDLDYLVIKEFII